MTSLCYQLAEPPDEPEADSRVASELDQIKLAVQLAFAERTGRRITGDQALAVAKRIMGGEPVRRPIPYVMAAIKRDVDPFRLLPGGRTGTPEDAALLAWLRASPDLAEHARR